MLRVYFHFHEGTSTATTVCTGVCFAVLFCQQWMECIIAANTDTAVKYSC